MTALAPTDALSRRRQLLVWLAFIGLDTATQLAFKLGAVGLGDMDFGLDMLARAVRLPGVWLAVAGYLGTFFVWMAILRDMPLSRAFPMTGLVYITVPLLAWGAFGEQIGPLRAGGIALIIGGVVLLGMEDGNERR